MIDHTTPYEALGNKLKDIREHLRESVAEVSGAVEIDEKKMSRIEAGFERPSEDVLLLLISHFNVHDDKAAELWQLAGYDKSKDQNDDQNHAMKNTMMIVIDPRVMYSDDVEIVANNQGVIVNFSQTSGTNNNPLTIARIGMSHDQAKMVMSALHQALYDLENPQNPRQLSDGKSSDVDK